MTMRQSRSNGCSRYPFSWLMTLQWNLVWVAFRLHRVLVILWLVGMVSSYTMGGLIHVLLVIAVIVLLLRIIQGRRVV